MSVSNLLVRPVRGVVARGIYEFPTVNRTPLQRQDKRTISTRIERVKNPEYVARGFKAAIHNPLVSAKAKIHARQQLAEMGVTLKPVAQKKSSLEHVRHQLGYKATLSNPLTSKEAKKHAKSVLNDAAIKNEKHVMGGYKATLKNPHASVKAKQQAEQVLNRNTVKA